MESWEGWCPVHGDYAAAQGGLSVVWWAEVDQQVAEQQERDRAAYYGFKTVDDFRRMIQGE